MQKNFGQVKKIMANIKERLEKFYRSGKFTDVTIYFGDGTCIKAHRVVLAKKSDFFHALFKHNWDQHTFHFPSHLIQDGAENFAQIIFDMLYDIDIKTDVVAESNVADLMLHADYFGMPDLTKHFHQKLTSLLDADNSILLLQFAYYFPLLHADVASYIAQNFLAVYEQNANFFSLSFEMLQAILSSKEMYAGTEILIWKAVLDWVRFDLTSRETLLAQFLPFIRLGLVSHSDLQKLIMEYKMCARNPDHTVFSKLTRYQAWKHSAKEDLKMPDIPKSMKLIRFSRQCALSCGGWTQLQASRNLELYDYEYNVWFTLPQSLPSARAYHGCVEVDGKMYIIGGYDGHTYYKALYSFDLASLQWEQLPPMHFRRCYVSTAVVNGNIYVMGGHDGMNENRRLTICEKFEPASNQWTVMANMKKSRSDACAVAYEGKIWIVGGFNGDRYLNTVESYNPDEDKWTPMKAMNYKRGGVGCAVLNGKLYAIGGHDGSSRLKTVECLDLNNPNAGWKDECPMYTKRSNFGVCSVGSRLIIVGGFEDPTTTAKCEWFDGERWHIGGDLGRAASALTLTTISYTSKLANSLKEEDVVTYVEKKRRNRIQYLKNLNDSLRLNWTPTDDETIKLHVQQLQDIQGQAFDVYILPTTCGNAVQEKSRNIIQEFRGILAIARSM